jgi:hypothetical protein
MYHTFTDDQNGSQLEIPPKIHDRISLLLIKLQYYSFQHEEGYSDSVIGRHMHDFEDKPHLRL